MHQCIETIDIKKFRELLGVPSGAYERGLDFQCKVIEPANATTSSPRVAMLICPIFAPTNARRWGAG
jgi:hypothetical protein